MRGVLLISLIAFLVSACGSETYPPAVFFSGDSQTSFILKSVNGEEVPENDSVSLVIVNAANDVTAKSLDCSGNLIARPLGATLQILRDGLGSHGCFISVPSDSNHLSVLRALQEGAPVEFDGSNLRIQTSSALYEFTITP